MNLEKIPSLHNRVKSPIGSSLFACAIYFFLLSSAFGLPVFSQDCSYEKFRSEQQQVYSFESVGLKMSVPESWEISNISRGEAVRVTVQSGAPCKISCSVTSRILSDEEENNRDRLLDAMLNGSINHLKSMDHEIIDVGKTDAFGPETAGFVIVSGKRQDNFATLSFGGLNDGRNVGVTIRSDAVNNRDAISKIIHDVVKTVRIR
jgi:hypothetical protein